MNNFAYLTTSLAIKKLSQLSKLNINIHGEENIPDGSIVFVANHFTRIETLFLPRHLHQLTGIPVWSLADYNLFKGPLSIPRIQGAQIVKIVVNQEPRAIGCPFQSIIMKNHETTVHMVDIRLNTWGAQFEGLFER